MAIKNRTQLKSYFVKNAIPTEGNFADLIDSQLNQAQDGAFKLEGEPFSLVVAPGAQKRALRLYANYPAENADWLISLSPAQDPADSNTTREGFGITDGAGTPRLFIDKATGKVGIGTNDPTHQLTIQGHLDVRGNGGVVDLVGVNHAYIQLFPTSTSAGRKGWIGFGGANTTTLTVQSQAGPLELSGTEVVVTSPLRINGNVSLLGKHAFRGNDSWLRLNQSGAFTKGVHTPGNFAPGSLNVGGHSGWGDPGNGNAWIEKTLTVFGQLVANGDVSLSGKHAFRGNDAWLRLNQDRAFTKGVHTPGNFAPGSLNVGGHSGWGDPGSGNAWIDKNLTVFGLLEAKNGSRFSGKQHHFTDQEAKGRLRVGAAWGVPGLYSEDNQDIVIGCHAGRTVWLGQTNSGVRVLDGRVGIGRAPSALNAGEGRPVPSLTTNSIELHDTLASRGRMHLAGPELCYMLHKLGVRISKAWGGSGSLFVEGGKHFLIDHPLDSERYLVHSAIEGPEAGVFYRGEGTLVDGACEVTLPPYFEALTRLEDRTVLLTPKVVADEPISSLAASSVADGKFTVRSTDERNQSQQFFWEVKAVRADTDPVDVEPLKTTMDIPLALPEDE